MATKRTSPKTRKPTANKPPTWDALTVAQRRAVTARMVRLVRIMDKAGKYKIVNSPVQVRDSGAVETTCEDRILDHYQRGRMLDLARDAARNSSTLNAILKQFDLQGVGTVGGKATFTFDDQAAADRVRAAFAAWTRDADFFDGFNLNTFLKVALKTFILGGDLVILFDDNLIEDSGRLVIFEPDEIGNIPEPAVKAAYGADAHQSLGRVYNGNGRFIGVVVSRHDRGSTYFNVDHCYTLVRDPAKPSLDEKWIMPRNVFRPSQGRGISQLASPLSTVLDLEDITEYELQASKKNAQTLAQVVDSGTSSEPVLPSAFEQGTDFSSMSDDEIAAAAKEEDAVNEQVVTFDQIRGAGVIYEVLPDGKKLEMLATNRPNANIPEFIRWLAGRAAAPFGLGSVYATLKADASYTAFRGEQVMSQPAFEEAQKMMEQICDWILRRWAVWSVRKGLVAAADLPADFWRFVQWQWPRMREVNQVDEQNAISLKLRNGTGSYQEIYGADWKAKLRQIADEVNFCKELGIVHPSAVTSAGAVIESQATTTNQTTQTT